MRRRQNSRRSRRSFYLQGHLLRYLRGKINPRTAVSFQKKEHPPQILGRHFYASARFTFLISKYFQSVTIPQSAIRLTVPFTQGSLIFNNSALRITNSELILDFQRGIHGFKHFVLFAYFLKAYIRIFKRFYRLGNFGRGKPR